MMKILEDLNEFSLKKLSLQKLFVKLPEVSDPNLESTVIMINSLRKYILALSPSMPATVPLLQSEAEIVDSLENNISKLCAKLSAVQRKELYNKTGYDLINHTNA